MTRPPALPSRVAAVLGPTNTGKTHFAVERMLAHGSGVMGFPLRLLAREIYDRVLAIVGESAVSLLTGEEQIGSETARYVVATVEAMPMQRAFAFLAVDEIQLCADRERGHVFTDRLLHARGAEETLFLGSDTIRPLLKQLVPEAEIISRPRFSVLRHSGSTKLNRLPRRSAVVAFTAADVYTLAEVMRRQKGGAAVVLGALSPRTRNAQVAMYQSGEVDHLVATDAIGMGLNMDLAHVAFAQLHKFDGNDTRRLTAPEIGQIAGRAGRHMADGTFGTTNGAGALDERIVEAVEAHRYMPIKRLRWRNSDLDFTSLEDLAASLDADPSVPGLVKVRDALDDRSLAILSRRDEIRDRARGPAGVRLLWQV
jgi:ATP-dependent RNA helicase SUPV3L1/SUV3